MLVHSDYCVNMGTGDTGNCVIILFIHKELGYLPVTFINGMSIYHTIWCDLIVHLSLPLHDFAFTRFI